MSWFRKSAVPELTLILDIQSAIVRGSLVLSEPDKVPEIVYSETREIPYRPDGGSAFLIKTSLEIIAETLTHISQYAYTESAAGHMPKVIRSVHYVLSSPWIVSQARTISLVLPKDVQITESRILDIIRKERPSMGIQPGDPVIVIEEKILDVRLNGYSIAEWRGKVAHNIAVSCVTSVAGTTMVDRFREACHHVVPAKNVFFHSALLLQTVGFRELMPDRANYLLIHVHGELTDVVTVEHGSCTFFGSFPTGVRTVIRTLAEQTGSEFQAADSLLALSTDEHIDPQKQASINTVLDAISTDWTVQIEELLAKNSGNGGTVSLARKNLIFFSKNHEDFFIRALEKTYPEARIEKLVGESLGTRIRYSSTVEMARVTGLYALALNSIR